MVTVALSAKSRARGVKEITSRKVFRGQVGTRHWLPRPLRRLIIGTVNEMLAFPGDYLSYCFGEIFYAC